MRIGNRGTRHVDNRQGTFASRDNLRPADEGKRIIVHPPAPIPFALLDPLNELSKHIIEATGSVSYRAINQSVTGAVTFEATRPGRIKTLGRKRERGFIPRDLKTTHRNRMVAQGAELARALSRQTAISVNV